ncbi:MAG: N-acetylglucosamine-6-phosphate deacetylase, partial [Firmicutes bacterium]|nr:N-acetylglucosamine-6-phosphate deacetylase [Bacillota bacterium]
KNTTGAEVVGVHLEGPFLSTANKGAQNADFLHDPDSEMLARLQEAAEGSVRLVTVAPEEPGGLEFIRAAVDMGITVSVGHTIADYDTAMEAFKAGASHATHLYNGMPPIHHRSPAVVGAAFDSPGVKAELICDGVHIHGAIVRLTFQLFGKERMVLISDSLRATGMPDGQYPFGGQEIEVHGNRATIVGHPETLAGSVTSLMGCLRQAVAFGIPLEDAVRACTYNPAQAIKIDDRAGTLDIGKEASIVLLNKDDLSVKKILFKGIEV